MTIGEYLRKKRLAIPRGLRDVARELGVSASYLSRIESGEDQPSAELLEKTARLYSVRLDKLLTMRGSEAVSAAARGYRVKANAEMRALYRIGEEFGEAELDDLLRSYLRAKGLSDVDIEKRISEYKEEMPRMINARDGLFALPARRRILTKSSIENMAERFLKRHGLDEESYAPPTEVECLVEMEPEIDYRIAQLKCRESGEPLVLGLTRWNLEGHKQIVINSALADSPREVDACRFNFTLGHELFHAIEHLPLTPRTSAEPLNRAAPLAEVIFVDRTEGKDRIRLSGRKSTAQRAVDTWATNARRKQLSSDEDWREWQANVFSSALLMPWWAIRSEFVDRLGTNLRSASNGENARELSLSLASEHAFGSYVFEQSMAEKFKVSRQAMAIRLLDLGLVREVDS